MPADPARIRQSVERYVAAWNEKDPTARAALLEQSCSAQIRVVAPNDPNLRGRASLESHITGFHHRRPGARGRLTSVIDVSGNAFRFAAVAEGSSVVPDIELMDAGECDDDGRIALILTFVGIAPERL